MNLFTYRVRLTPRGKHIIEVLYGEEVIATGKQTYSNAEDAHVDMREAFKKISLKDVLHDPSAAALNADALFQPNVKSVELVR